jgi:hypothetical protein
VVVAFRAAILIDAGRGEGFGCAASALTVVGPDQGATRTGGG